jgi:hypothetical protein
MIKMENGIQVETFGDSTMLSPNMPKAIKDYQDFAASLGFTRMAKNIDLRLATGELSSYKALTAQESRNLNRHFPRMYWVGNQTETRGSGYAFDTIPLGVLHILNRARKAELFDAIYIGTPERAAISDPVLVGIAGRECFILARWGEALRPLEFFIGRQSLLQRWYTHNDKPGLAIMILALLSLGITALLGLGIIPTP